MSELYSSPETLEQQRQVLVADTGVLMRHAPMRPHEVWRDSRRFIDRLLGIGRIGWNLYQSEIIPVNKLDSTAPAFKIGCYDLNTEQMSNRFRLPRDLRSSVFIAEYESLHGPDAEIVEIPRQPLQPEDMQDEALHTSMDQFDFKLRRLASVLGVHLARD